MEPSRLDHQVAFAINAGAPADRRPFELETGVGGNRNVFSFFPQGDFFFPDF